MEKVHDTPVFLDKVRYDSFSLEFYAQIQEQDDKMQAISEYEESPNDY